MIDPSAGDVFDGGGKGFDEVGGMEVESVDLVGPEDFDEDCDSRVVLFCRLHDGLCC